jgi:hypothetical protein
MRSGAGLPWLRVLQGGKALVQTCGHDLFAQGACLADEQIGY